MRCRICGAQLKNEGDICKNCYSKYNEKIKLNKEDEPVQFTIKRKYSPKFNLLKNGEIIVLALIVILAAFSSYNKIIAILITLLTLILFGLWMFYNKKRASGTKTTFYKTKLKYKAKYLFINREEAVAYDDIKDMAYFQTRSQKICKIGDIRFYTQGFLSGITIHDIPDIQENFNKIKDLINSTRT